MNALLPTTRAPGSDGAGDGPVRTTCGLRIWKLDIAVGIVTDFVGYSDVELRAAADLIIATSHPQVNFTTARRAERILQALEYAA